MSAVEDTRTPQIPFWNDPKTRSVAVQIIIVVALVLGGYYLYSNAVANLAKLNKTFGYEFWDRTAGFDIIQSMIPYTSDSSYGTAIITGFLNTLLIAILGIIFATLIGFLVGIMRLSKNWLVAKIAMVYIETIRNVPLLLQLFVWYKLVLVPLPDSREALNLADMFFLSKKGLNMPLPVYGPGGWMAIAGGLIAGVIGAIVLRRWAVTRQMATGQIFPHLSVGILMVVLSPFVGLLLAGWPVTLDYPMGGVFGFKGGVTVVPELIAMLVGISVYTASFIAEIVRAGIQAVSHGQTEAASALGIRPSLTTRLVIVPQAMRIIIPPLASQYLNLTKNSSLGVAIAYPELVSTGGTVLNQTGKAIEIVLIWMVVYLSLSLLTSLFMNWFNARVKLVER
jgi:general L-amino acid transport system permease protein